MIGLEQVGCFVVEEGGAALNEENWEAVCNSGTLMSDDAQLLHEFLMRDLSFFRGELTESAECWGPADLDLQMLDLVNNWGVGVGWSVELGKTV